MSYGSVNFTLYIDQGFSLSDVIRETIYFKGYTSEDIIKFEKIINIIGDIVNTVCKFNN